MRRLPHLSRGEFQQYWRETHAALALKRADTLGIRRYVQVHTVDSAINDALRESRGGAEPYDGVAEIWWDSIEDVAAAISSPEGQQASQELLEDERRFIDLSRSTLWVAQEHQIIGG